MDWQQIQPGSDSGLDFFKFCDTLEVKDGQNAPESGWGLDNALKAWSTYFRDDYLQSSESMCLLGPFYISADPSYCSQCVAPLT